MADLWLCNEFAFRIPLSFFERFAFQLPEEDIAGATWVF